MTRCRRDRSRALRRVLRTPTPLGYAAIGAAVITALAAFLSLPT